MAPMATFVVRVWDPGAGQSETAELHGTIRHVESGVEEPFASADALLVALQALAGSTRPE